MSTSTPAAPHDHIHVSRLAVQTVAGPDLWQRLAPQHCALTLDVPMDFSAAAASDNLAHSLNYATLSRQLAQHVRSRSNWGSLHTLAVSAHADIVGRYSAQLPWADSVQLHLRSSDAHLRTRDVGWSIGGCGPMRNTLHVGALELFACIGVFQFERVAKQRVSLDIAVEWPGPGPGPGQVANASASANTVVPPLPVKRVIDDVVRYVEHSDFYTVEALVESVAKVVQQCLPQLPTSVHVRVAKLSAITDTEGVGVSCLRSGEELNELPEVVVQPETIVSKEQRSGPETIVSKEQRPGPETIVSTPRNGKATAYIAFGSNVGDRLLYIEQALRILAPVHGDDHPITTSSLFESEPMYFKDQRPFLNGCIKMSTTLSPTALLALCKDIEYKELKRTKEFENGPRSIDLDIILYYDHSGNPVVMDTPALTIPHPRMLERTFVLEPLCELLPPTATHPLTAEPMGNHLQQLYDQGNPADTLWRLLPIPGIESPEPRFLRFRTGRGPTVGELGQSTGPAHIMAIVNTTPDSFSDGDPEGHSDVARVVARVESMAADVLRHYDSVIVDVGGCSTRPGSPQPSEVEEMERVVPVLRAIRASKVLDQEKIVLSVDTYRAAVARAAIENGCDMINDVSGGQFDNAIWEVVGQHPRVAYVLSHTRGTIDTMTQCADYNLDQEYIATDPQDKRDYFDYIGSQSCDPADAKLTLVRTVSFELAERYSQLLAGPINRWQVVLDPGLGFAKNLHENVQLLRDLNLFRNYSLYMAERDNSTADDFITFRNLPVLVGPSRKRFIGTLTKEEDPASRDFATGAVVTAAIGNGADIVRVHNASECTKAAVMADALYK